MTPAEVLKTTGIHRIAGRTGRRTAVVTTRPFRAPHQPMAAVRLIGGGQVPMPGEGARAHHGVRSGICSRLGLSA
jgi:magnesium chelatase family protein